jgi:hypothetical protein
LLYAHKQGDSVKLPVRIDLEDYWKEAIETAS